MTTPRVAIFANFMSMSAELERADVDGDKKKKEESAASIMGATMTRNDWLQTGEALDFYMRLLLSINAYQQKGATHLAHCILKNQWRFAKEKVRCH